MATISHIGNQIYINQNMGVVANKFASYNSRLTAQDIINAQQFEEDNKRLKETRETEETAEIDEHLIDGEVYKTTPKFPKRERREEEKGRENRYIVDSANKKIDVKI